MKKKLLLKANSCPTIDEAISIYLRKCTVKNMSERTIRLYRIDIADFLKYCAEEIEFINEITSSTVDNYIQTRRQSQSCSQITINSHLRSIRAFLYWAMEERYITNPFTVTIPKTEKKIKETFCYCNEIRMKDKV